MTGEPIPPTEDMTRLAGRYSLLQSLGRGGFGEVFLASDYKYNPPRKVAVKQLHPQYLDSPHLVVEIVKEASALARFSHPNILRVLDYDITPDLAYIVTELAEGGSLAHKIRLTAGKPSLRLSLDEVANYLEKICAGLDEAHAAGLIHRDLKPQNILLDKHNQPLIADFGIATAIDAAKSALLITTDPGGTPPYIAPEVWQRKTGRASDIYALGIITYQLITGQLPYQGSSQVELMYQHLQAPIPKLSDLAPDLEYPAALDDALAGALAKDPEQRTRPAMEFYRRFKAAISPSSAPVPKPVPVDDVSVKLIEPRLITMWSDHTALIFALAFSPDGKMLASGSDDWMIKLRDTTTYRKIMSFNAFSEVRSIAFSPDSTLLVSGAYDRTIKLWDTIKSKQVKKFKGHSHIVESVAFNQNNRLIASGAMDKSIIIWDTITGRQVNKLPLQGGSIISVAFSPDGKLLASSSIDYTIKLWEVNTGREIRSLEGQGNSGLSFAFSPDGKILAAGSKDKTIKLWEVASGREVRRLSRLAAASSPIVFSGNSSFLAFHADGNTIKLCDLINDREGWSLSGFTSAPTAIAIRPDGKQLACSFFDKSIKIWQIAH